MSKYKSKWTEYNGRKYQSVLESTRAQQLDLLKKADEIIEWEPQFKIPLYTAVEDKQGNLTRIRVCDYIIDFKITSESGIYFEEIKGFENEIFKIKYKWLKLQHPNWDVRVLTKREIG